MTTVDDAAVKYAEGLAEALIGKLGLVLLQEYQLLSGVRGEVVLLRDDAAMMNALLRMFSEADQDVVDHFVREWMKQVRELVYDGEDCIDLFFSRISWAPRGTNWLGRAWQKVLTLYPRHGLANDIKDLRARAIAISERRGRYGVYGQALKPSEAFGSRVPTSSMPPVIGGVNDDPSQLVGIAAQIETLCNILGPRGVDAHTDQTRKVCSIVGIGGVGKTTLALAVCRELKTDFPYQLVVAVSQEFDPSKIAAEINKLKDKRYLVVIDDVWTKSAWDAINKMLPQKDLGSRIIVTTRNEAVAEAACTSEADYIHRAQILNDKDSESLFIRRVFGQKVPLRSSTTGSSSTQGNDDASASSNPTPLGECPEELQVEMGIILEKCGGLPLAIVCIANVLARYNSPTSIGMWTRVCNSVGSQLETNPALEGMMQIIALSYNQLPYNMKACAMILSFFPEDYHIPKWRLLRRWISEGLIPDKRGLTSLDVAEAYYDELLSRNIIQLVALSDGTVSVGHCCLHDMMREVIVSKSLEENFVSLVGTIRGGTSYDPVRRLCIHGDVGYVADGRSMQHVRSLTTFGDKKNVGVGKLLDGLSKFTLVRVLDLEDCKDVTNKHMKQVCRLFLLRLLNLNGTDITELPSEITNLHDLQSLMLWDTLLNEVPVSVVDLEKLEYLSFQNRDNLDIKLKLPKGIQKMKALQQLTRLEIGKDDVELAKEIGELTQLRVLGVFVLSGRSEGVKEAVESSFAKLRLCSLGEESIEYQDSPTEPAALTQEVQSENH